jgi:spermidine/putrescine transport system ATP-binding protein
MERGGVIEQSGQVELVSVTKRFGAFTAVDQLSLHVRSGEFLTLLGPSGCGKTTTLRMVAGFEQPTSGQIVIDGAAAAGLPPFKRNVNTVFQNYALFPHLSVRDNVAFGLKMKGVGRSERALRVQEALDLVQLSALAERRPNQLSGGQQQRVALARALVNHPAVLLLDEPLGALDLKLRKAMQLELSGLQQRVGITFVYVTHDQEEALTMSDRIAVMNEGRLLQLGTPSEIYERPNSRFVADFIGESNFLDGVVADRVEAGMLVHVDGVGMIRTSGAATAGARATLAIRPEKITIGRGGSPALNTVSGTVVTAVFRGSDTQVIARLGNGCHFAVQLPNQGSARPEDLRPGTAVELTWDPACTVLLTA